MAQDPTQVAAYGRGKDHREGKIEGVTCNEPLLKADGEACRGGDETDEEVHEKHCSKRHFEKEEYDPDSLLGSAETDKSG